jgi:hypothetical protein
MQFTTDRMKKIVTIDKVTDNPKSIQLAIENYSICMENRLRKENKGRQRRRREMAAATTNESKETTAKKRRCRSK